MTPKQEEAQLKQIIGKMKKLQFAFFKQGFILFSVTKNPIVKGVNVISIVFCNLMLNTINHES